MTLSLRSAGLLTLAILFALLSTVGVAAAQEEDPSCYPVPPGGCETEPPATPTPTPTPTPPPTATSTPSTATCEDIVTAIAEGDVSMDQNGDGAIDAADLPASCTCEELIQAVEDGTLSESDLPDACVESQVAAESEEEPEVAVLADTGMPAAPVAALAALIMLAGAALVGLTRRA